VVRPSHWALCEQHLRLCVVRRLAAQGALNLEDKVANVCAWYRKVTRLPEPAPRTGLCSVSHVLSDLRLPSKTHLSSGGCPGVPQRGGQRFGQSVPRTARAKCDSQSFCIAPHLEPRDMLSWRCKTLSPRRQFPHAVPFIGTGVGLRRGRVPQFCRGFEDGETTGDRSITSCSRTMTIGFRATPADPRWNP